ncbi:MAG: sugar transferase [Bacteroidales bacterium]|jgi:lipopolysaccharide/colanic/teichoic acid biosynthesis glycosyltransferase|nr:sugar transferase [Bacteroidota bacterium]HHW59727.1 sugar transferase [Bacteroidales bacterium]
MKYSIFKRGFDFLFSLIFLIILLPFFLIISLMIITTDGFPIFYNQKRVGKDQKIFKILKFRTMKKNAETQGKLTIGEKDPRITKIGYFLRKYKIDELPQLWNILKGDMSFIGPRPEVPEYVAMYNDQQKEVLSVRPGLSDYASLRYINENEILSHYPSPDDAYINILLPQKIKLSKKYIAEMSLKTDFEITIKTIKKILNNV